MAHRLRLPRTGSKRMAHTKSRCGVAAAIGWLFCLALLLGISRFSLYTRSFFLQVLPGQGHVIGPCMKSFIEVLNPDCNKVQCWKLHSVCRTARVCVCTCYAAHVALPCVVQCTRTNYFPACTFCMARTFVCMCACVRRLAHVCAAASLHAPPVALWWSCLGM